jgi:hypothetical protein
MAKAVISNKIYGETKSAKTKSFSLAKVFFKPFNTVISGINHNTKTIRATAYPVTKISERKINTKVTETLPFRVRFTTIGIESYGPGNPAPIGIAVIGINNYIL